MDLEVTDDQRVLLEASTRFMEDHYPLEALRAGGYADASAAAKYLTTAGELGWFGLLVAEEHGGGSVSGNGVLDAALVAYHRGRMLQPGPFVGANVVAHALSSAGSEPLRRAALEEIVAGRRSAVWAAAPPRGEDVFDGVVATSVEGGYLLSGTKTLVCEADASSWLLLSVRSDEGPSLFLVPVDAEGVQLEPLESLDISRRFARLRLDGVKAGATALVGGAGQAEELATELTAIAAVLTAAESVGAMDRDFATAVDYAKNRIAFGRPIGSFQAVKHLLADTSLALEMSKAVTSAAAQALGCGDPYGRQAASIAKSFVGDHGIDLAQNCFQVFGGIGFTWEHDQHLYLRRLTTDAALFGSPSHHREALCRLSGI